MMEEFFTSVGMLLAMGGIIVASWGVSRFLGKRFGSPVSGKQIRVLERISLGPDRSLFLVEYKNHMYLLSSSPSGIRFIDKIEKESNTEEKGCENG